MTRGHWLWSFHDAPGGATRMAYATYTDVGEASWLIRQFCKMEPFMEHGITVSASIIAVRNMAREAARRAGK